MSSDVGSTLPAPITRRKIAWVIAASVTGFVVLGGSIMSRRNADRRKQKLAVLGSLRQIDGAMTEYHRRTGKSPSSLDDLVGRGKMIAELHPVPGVDYRSLDLSSADLLRVRMSDGTEVVYSRVTGTGVNPPR